MIETISDFYCHQGYGILSLALAFEHPNTKFTETGQRRLAKNILNELIKYPHFDENSSVEQLVNASNAL